MTPSSFLAPILLLCASLLACGNPAAAQCEELRSAPSHWVLHFQRTAGECPDLPDRAGILGGSSNPSCPAGDYCYFDTPLAGGGNLDLPGNGGDTCTVPYRELKTGLNTPVMDCTLEPSSDLETLRGTCFWAGDSACQADLTATRQP